MLLCQEASNIMVFHASPVEHLNRVRKAFGKLWKFTWKPICLSFPPALLRSIMAKLCMPVTANMKRKRPRSRRKEARTGAASIKVYNIIFSLRTLISFCIALKLRSFKMRQIRSTRRNALSWGILNSSIVIRITTVEHKILKSNKFHRFLKYSLAWAVIFNAASIVKRAKKSLSMIIRTNSSSSEIMK